MGDFAPLAIPVAALILVASAIWMAKASKSRLPEHVGASHIGETPSEMTPEQLEAARNAFSRVLFAFIDKNSNRSFDEELKEAFEKFSENASAHGRETVDY